jgi:hypothetical protein
MNACCTSVPWTVRLTIKSVHPEQALAGRPPAQIATPASRWKALLNDMKAREESVSVTVVRA